MNAPFCAAAADDWAKRRMILAAIGTPADLIDLESFVAAIHRASLSIVDLGATNVEAVFDELAGAFRERAA